MSTLVLVCGNVFDGLSTPWPGQQKSSSSARSRQADRWQETIAQRLDQLGFQVPPWWSKPRCAYALAVRPQR
jgi:hypothetical protein